MKIYVGEKIRIYPNKDQEALLFKAVGVARYAYNWGLEMWQTLYRDGQKPNKFMLNRGLNEIKREYFPWMYDVSKRAAQEAILNLGNAFDRFFKGESNYPKFKKKRGKQSVRIDDGEETIRLYGKKVSLPKLKDLELAYVPRHKGRIIKAVISLEACRIWHISFTIETEIKPIICENQTVVGADLGISTLVTLSNGIRFDNKKFLRSKLKKLHRFSRSLSRKKKGSNNFRKSIERLSKLHWVIANQRRDFTHKLTNYLIRNFSTICLEDLNVKGMQSNHKLSLVISELGLYEIRRQCQYKSKWHSRNFVLADRFFPSTKLCSETGALNENITLSDRVIACVCGKTHDRDLNAAKNLENYALRRVAPEVKPGYLSVGL